MSNPIAKSLIDEQIEENESRNRPALVRGTFTPPWAMLVADLPFQMKAE